MVDTLYSPTLGKLPLREVLLRMAEFQRERPAAHYRLLIGTDSLPASNGKAALVTAIVLLREGNGGIYFWLKETHSHLVTLRLRMVQETLSSIEVAKKFVEHIDCLPILSGDIEIHVDIGHQGPTRDMIREIAGMVKANGFPVFTKPFAVAASTVADRHTCPS
ncbi:MAG: ribonuclease H-like YkuK family protein [bacterium]